MFELNDEELTGISVWMKDRLAGDWMIKFQKYSYILIKGHLIYDSVSVCVKMIE